MSVIDQIIWKTNNSGVIQARDLVTLSWISLNMLNLPNDADGKQNSPISPYNIYSGKVTALTRFIGPGSLPGDQRDKGQRL